MGPRWRYPHSMKIIAFSQKDRIIPNLSAILSDPSNFEKPEIFDPDRFLSQDTGKFVPHPALVVYGIGKRECLGKSLAKNELYLFLVGLLHQFSFFPSEKGLPDLDNAIITITRVPKPFYVRIVPRSS